MYHLYIIDEEAYEPKVAIGDYSSLDKAHARLDKEFAKNKDLKYIIEETTGSFNSYGDLIAEVVEEN